MRWLLIFALGGLVACGAPPPPVPTDGPTAVPVYARVNGYDPTSQADISPINVWDNYQTRGAVVVHVRTGDRVQVLAEQGEGAFIETYNGTRGWVSRAFLKPEP